MNGFKQPHCQHANSITYEQVENTRDWLLERTEFRPVLGIVCGSGLGGLAEALTDKQVFDYKDIPNFLVSTVVGHVGRLVFGRLGGKDVVCMQGRFHPYEGYPLAKVTFPIRVMALMGVQTVFVTNAAGGLNPDYKVGDVMLIKDHINFIGLAGLGPLVGSSDTRFGRRFVPLSDAYTLKLRNLAKEVAKEHGIDYLKEGVYSIQCGPCFETVAECRMLRLLGADVTGMSSVPEVTIARQHGMEVLGISLVTNMCVMDLDVEQTANHEEVLETGRMRAASLEKFVTRIVELLPDRKAENGEVKG